MSEPLDAYGTDEPDDEAWLDDAVAAFRKALYDDPPEVDTDAVPF